MPNAECDNHAENMKELSQLMTEVAWLEKRLQEAKSRILRIERCPLGERA